MSCHHAAVGECTLDTCLDHNIPQYSSVHALNAAHTSHIHTTAVATVATLSNPLHKMVTKRHSHVVYLQMVRWDAIAANLGRQLEMVLGDALLSAAFVCYCGAFTGPYRCDDVITQNLHQGPTPA